jgi:alpha-amylase
MNGDVTGGTCTGPAYAVDGGGQVTATVPAGGALALHTGARVSGGSSACPGVTTTFEENATTVWGENVFVVGDAPALGNWDPAQAVALSSAGYPVWRGSATLPAGVTVQYKYLKKNGSQVVWESDPNRMRTTPGSAPCAATWADSWR